MSDTGGLLIAKNAKGANGCEEREQDGVCAGPAFAFFGLDSRSSRSSLQPARLYPRQVGQRIPSWRFSMSSGTRSRLRTS